MVDFKVRRFMSTTFAGFPFQVHSHLGKESETGRVARRQARRLRSFSFEAWMMEARSAAMPSQSLIGSVKVHSSGGRFGDSAQMSRRNQRLLSHVLYRKQASLTGLWVCLWHIARAPVSFSFPSKQTPKRVLPLLESQHPGGIARDRVVLYCSLRLCSANCRCLMVCPSGFPSTGLQEFAQDELEFRDCVSNFRPACQRRSTFTSHVSISFWDGYVPALW